MIRVIKLSLGDFERYQKEMLSQAHDEDLELKSNLLAKGLNYNMEGVPDVQFASVIGGLAHKYNLEGALTADKVDALIAIDAGFDPSGQDKLIEDPFEYLYTMSYTHNGKTYVVSQAAYDAIEANLKMKIFRPDGMGNRKGFFIEVNPTKLRRQPDGTAYYDDVWQDNSKHIYHLNAKELQTFDEKLAKQKTIRIEIDGKLTPIPFNRTQFKREITTRKGEPQKKLTTVPCIEMLYAMPKSYSALLAKLGDIDPVLQAKAFAAFDASFKKVIQAQVMDQLVSQGGEKLIGIGTACMHLGNRLDDPHGHIHFKLSTHGQAEDGKSYRIDLRKLGFDKTEGRQYKLLDALIQSDFTSALVDLGVDFVAQNGNEDFGERFADQAITKIDVAIDESTAEKLKGLSKASRDIHEAVAKKQSELEAGRDHALNLLSERLLNHEITDEVYDTQLTDIHKKYADESRYLHSSAGREDIHNQIKKAKTKQTREEQQQVFAEKFSELGIADSDFQRVIHSDAKGSVKNSLADNHTLTDQEKMDQIIELLTDKQVTFTRDDVLMAVARQFSALSFEAIQFKVDEILASKNILIAERPNSTRLEYTSAMLLKSSQHIDALCLDLGRDRLDAEGKFSIPVADIQAFFHAKKMDPQGEQAQVIQRFFANNERLKVALGFAGTGKSYTASKAKDLAAAHGLRTYGTAIMGATVDELAKEGIEGQTLAQLFIMAENAARNPKGNDAAYLNAMRGQILIVDEGSLISTTQGEKLLSFIKKFNMKALIIGDAQQYNSVQTGAFMSQLQDNVMGASILKEIRRQRPAENQIHLENAKILSGSKKIAELEAAGLCEAEILQRYSEYMRTGEQVKTFFENLEDIGLIQFEATEDLVRAALVEKFLACDEPAHEKLVIGSTNEEVDKLNTLIRDRLLAEDLTKPKAKRRFKGESVVISTPEGQSSEYLAGDRILITKNDADNGVKNGQIGTIQSIAHGPEGVVIQFLKDGDKKPTTIQLGKDSKGQPQYSMTLGYALTSYKTQGKTVNKTFIMLGKDPTASANNIYVTATRHRMDATYFAVDDQYEEIKKAYMRSGVNEDIRDFTVRQVPLAKPESSIQVPKLEMPILQQPTQAQKKLEGIELNLGALKTRVQDAIRAMRAKAAKAADYAQRALIHQKMQGREQMMRSVNLQKTKQQQPQLKPKS